MSRILPLLLLLFTPLFSNTQKKPDTPKKYKIGVCVMATGSYDASAQSLIESGRRFFCVDHQVTYFVFTDGTHLGEAQDVIRVQQTFLGWPFDSLKRFHVYEQHHKLFEELDYIFAIDADMLFVAPVGEEILSDRVAIQHPAHYRKRGIYENRKISTAFVGPQEGEYYFTAQFYGGNKTEFVKLLKVLKKQVDLDLSKKFIARMYGESHLNRYFIDHPPTRVLSPSYCYPESWQLEFPKKIVASCHSQREQPR